MSKKHQQRLVLLILFVVGLCAVAALFLFALNQNINLFYTPTQILSEKPKQDVLIRVGGMVVEGSVKRQEGLNVAFQITDFENTLTLHYQGILPDLFREGQGIVAKGKFGAEGSFVASEVLAKHDEKYMPPEIKHLKSENT